MIAPTVVREPHFDPELKNDKQQWARDNLEALTHRISCAGLAQQRGFAFALRQRATAFRAPRLAIFGLSHGLNRSSVGHAIPVVLNSHKIDCQMSYIPLAEGGSPGGNLHLKAKSVFRRCTEFCLEVEKGAHPSVGYTKKYLSVPATH